VDRHRFARAQQRGLEDPLGLISIHHDVVRIECKENIKQKRFNNAGGRRERRGVLLHVETGIRGRGWARRAER
jgi:hypothetical protein